MKFTVAALSALVAVAAAEQPKFLNSKFDVTEGEPFTLKFSACTSGCTIILQTGSRNNLKDVETLTSSATGGSFTFTPDNLPSNTYSFKIVDNSNPNDNNYSTQFSYQGSGSVTGSGTSAPTTAAATTAAASTSAATTTTAISSMTTVTTSDASSSSAVSTGSNSTTSATSTSSRASSTTQAATTAPTKIPGSGAGRLSSPLALVAGAVAAMAYLS